MLLFLLFQLLIFTSALKSKKPSSMKNLKTLDVLLTNLWELYSVPVVVPAVPCDDPNKGVASDHSTPIAHPLSTEYNIKNVYKNKVSQPLPDSGIQEFGQWILNEDWASVPDDSSPTEQVERLEELTNSKMNKIFSKVSYRVTQQDKAWISFELKKLDRLKKREYRRHGKSAKYLELLNKFNEKYKIAAKKHLDKSIRSLKEENPGKAYSALKKMGAQPGDCLDEGSFRLTEHVESNLSIAESAENIAQHFAKISQQYQPLDVSKLPKYVKDIMEDQVYDFELPTFTAAEVWDKIEHAKKPKGGVPGDLPKKILNEFAPELATPATKIFQNMVRKQQWPKQWKKEYGIPLQKVKNPVNEDHGAVCHGMALILHWGKN